MGPGPAQLRPRTPSCPFRGRTTPSLVGSGQLESVEEIRDPGLLACGQGRVGARVGEVNLLTFTRWSQPTGPAHQVRWGPRPHPQASYLMGQVEGRPRQARPLCREQGLGVAEALGPPGAADPPSAAPPATWWPFGELRGLAGELGSRADSGEAQPFTGSLPCSRTCGGSPVPHCHRVSPELSPHQPGQAPQPPVYCMLCSFCPGFGPSPRPLPPHCLWAFPLAPRAPRGTSCCCTFLSVGAPLVLAPPSRPL